MSLASQSAPGVLGCMQEWVRRGHGEYREIQGEKEFFAEMKGEERMVCHFYRENWPCKVGRQEFACAHAQCATRVPP